ncbi:unnamed protein product [Lathyrus sativus]|nr:unnamed protein product [Lathyrus sativus]
MELMDFPVVGNKFTWLKANGSFCSRLAKILLSEDLISNWNIMAQVMGDIDILDHRLVWIKDNVLNWGSKPFKAFRSWFEHLGFLEFVMKEWNSISGGKCCSYSICKV